MPESEKRSGYEPISCDFYDVLEEMTVRKKHCRIAYVDRTGTPREMRGIPNDLYSKKGAEFLKFEDGRVVRLDRILAVNDEPVSPARRSATAA